MSPVDCQVLVLGAGPGGYSTALRAAQLGLDVVVVDGGPPGGTCLNVGCIPSKALIHAADAYAQAEALARVGGALGIRAGAPTLDMAVTTAWKDEVVGRLVGGVRGLLRRAGVRAVEGRARVRDGKSVEVAGAGPDGSDLRIRCQHLVLATGSVPAELPSLPFGPGVLSSTEVLALTERPGHLAVVGAGYIGLELGTALAKLGSRVTVIEAAERILPAFDAELSGPVEARLRALGVEVLTGTTVVGAGRVAGSVVVRGGDGGQREVTSTAALVAVGRRPATEGWGLEDLDLDRSGPFVAVDLCGRTSMTGVYGVGDLTGEPMLAHRAVAQGLVVAEVVAGLPSAWDVTAVPAVAFTDPEVVTVGLDRAGAEAIGLDVVVGSFPFRANGRALSTGDDDGFVRVVARADDHVLVGVQAVGAGVSELASSFASALEMGARVEDVAATVHAHPTRGEAFPEAALVAMGRPLHI